MMMWKKLSAGIAGAIACGSLVLMTGCNLHNDNSFQRIPTSYVLLYNASPDAPDLNIRVDGKPVGYHRFEYGDNTGYLPFYTGDRNLKIGPYGADNVVVDTVVELVDNRAYSIFVVDEFNKASLLVLRDSASLPDAGKAKIRFVNLSPDAGGVRLKVKDAAGQLVETKFFKEASGFVEVDAKNYDFEVTSEANSTINLQIPSVNLGQGWVYTILVRGYQTPPSGNNNVLSAQVISN